MVKNFNVGVKGIVMVDGKCLVLKKRRTDIAYWDIPGGRIDDNETLEEALTRELREELPSLVDYHQIEEVVSAHRHSSDISDGVGLVFIFFKVIASPFILELTEEHEGYQWVDVDTVETLLDTEYRIEPKYYSAITRALEID